jgi:protein ImuA
MSLSAHTLPDVWRASELARPPGLVLPTGHAALDAALPGGGWPVGGISELLQAPGLHAEWGLLAPALSQLAAQAQAPRSGRSAVVLIGAPWLPFGPALAARGCVPGSLLQVQVDTLADRLWAAEQALRCADVPAVLLWLGAVPAAALRRLQTLAQEHGRLLFVCRPPSARQEASPAPLRLSLDWPQAQAEACGRLPALQVEVFKRRGPPLAAPLLLQMQPSALQQLLAASHGLARRRRARLVQTLALSEVSDAVDRAQSLA